MAKISVHVVPVSGKATTSEVEVGESGSSLKEVIDAGKLDVARMQVAVDGEPVDATKPHLVHVKAGAKITLTEKARGS